MYAFMTMPPPTRTGALWKPEAGKVVIRVGCTDLLVQTKAVRITSDKVHMRDMHGHWVELRLLSRL